MNVIDEQELLRLYTLLLIGSTERVVRGGKGWVLCGSMLGTTDSDTFLLHLWLAPFVQLTVLCLVPEGEMVDIAWVHQSAMN